MIHPIIDEIKEMFRNYQTLKNVDVHIYGFDDKYKVIFVYRIINIMNMVALESSLYRLSLISVRMKHNGVESSKLIRVYAYKCPDSLPQRLT
jgi:hypothetical protein